MGNLGIMAIKYKIVLVPYPFDDQIQQKVRPAVCLTEPIGNHEHIVVSYITSQIPETMEESDIMIESTSQGFQSTGLLLSSVLRLHRMITIPSRSIRREIGELPEEFKKETTLKLSKLFLL